LWLEQTFSQEKGLDLRPLGFCKVFIGKDARVKISSDMIFAIFEIWVL
jgi:hypothetical protein